MTNLSTELAKQMLIEADEVKKASVAKMKHRNRGTSEIKNATSAVKRSERHDTITQIVQDGGFTADVAPGNKGLSDDIAPQADFADTYTEKMPHGMTGGMGSNGENQGSPKVTGTDDMTPNQTTKLRQVDTKPKRTEDDGDQKVFSIPQADFADEYTQKMAHGRAGGTTDEDTGGATEPAKRKYGKMDGGPTRAGGTRKHKGGDNVVGARDKDSQKPSQVTGPSGFVSDPSDAPKKPTWKKETGGSHNIYESQVESGVEVTLNGKPKAQFEVVNHRVLQRMQESYAQHGYEVEFTRGNAAWKTDRKFLKTLRESINARFNHAPEIAKVCRKAAMQRFGQLCRESYNSLYESQQEFVSTMGAAFKRIEKIAEDKYVDGLEYFNCMARGLHEGERFDIELVTRATDPQMACRQVRNTLHEEYGFDLDIRHIFVDGQKFTPARIKEYKPAIKVESKKRRKTKEG